MGTTVEIRAEQDLVTGRCWVKMEFASPGKTPWAIPLTLTEAESLADTLVRAVRDMERAAIRKG